MRRRRQCRYRFRRLPDNMTFARMLQHPTVPPGEIPFASQLLVFARELSVQDSEVGVYQLLMDQVRTLARADFVQLALYAGDAFAGRFGTQGLIDAPNSRPLPEEERCARTRHPLIIGADGEARDLRMLREQPFDARAGFLPLFSGQDVIAVLVVGREGGWLTAAEMDTLATLGEHGGIAIARARLVKQVIAAKKEWERMFDAIGEGLALIGHDGTIRRLNVALASWGKMTPQEAIGSVHHDLLRELGGDEGGCPVCETLRTGARAERVVERTGDRALRIVVTPYSRGGAVLVVTDVTAERRSEEQVRSAQARMFEMEKLAAVGRLAAGVSHEVNNPLMGISGLAAVLLEEPGLDAETLKIVEMIQREARRATKITRDMLQLVRGEEARFESIDVNEIVREVTALRATTQQDEGIATTLALDERAGVVTASRAQLFQVMVNLITNAEDAVADRDERRIRVTTGRTTDGAVVRVEDTGAGIPAEHLARIFEPFFTTKAPGKGTGLGLALCHSIIERHGGSLTAENVVGGGARFTIALVASPPKLPGVRSASPTAIA